ncbi:hypothetical protein [Kitasatospora fiedleri]|uniref:hypothetical protein n=1 Tax=Kitasatospora fiedleri TaxID=2991545 RepID=UPI00249A2118|nr:hypothetical protein [Kitasatospora fiedleri]
MSEPVIPPAVNEHGFPDATPVAEMEPAHQVAYWKHHARRHEQRANAAPTAEELEKLRADAAELATRKAGELSETQRLQAEKDAAEQRAAQAQADAAAATRRALVLEVAGMKGLTPAQAERLRGATREELDADADALKSLFAGATSGNAGGAGVRTTPDGREPGAAKTVAAGASRYKSPYGAN